WQTGRPVSSSDRPAPGSLPASSTDAFRHLERIARAVVREAALLRQHSRGSVAVILRPGAQTQLHLHLAQRNGEMEASVRCERGNFQQLNALWPQLQETLAGQRVRLAPLQDSALATGDSPSNAAAENAFSQSGQHSRRHGPEEGSLAER